MAPRRAPAAPDGRAHGCRPGRRARSAGDGGSTREDAEPAPGACRLGRRLLGDRGRRHDRLLERDRLVGRVDPPEHVGLVGRRGLGDGGRGSGDRPVTGRPSTWREGQGAT